MRLKQIILFFLLGLPLTGGCQMVFRNTTQFAFSGDPDIVIEAPANITTNGATDFTGAKVQLSLTGTDQTISGNLFLTTLSLKGIGIKTISNNVTISGTMDFTEGILEPSGGKILFTGAGADITGGSDASFVDGPFYQSGGGARFFPVGAGTTYAFARFDNVAAPDELGVEVIPQDAGLVVDNIEILEADNSRYWQLHTTSPETSVNTRISLGLNGLSGFTGSGEGVPAVIQADDINLPATSLGSYSVDETQVTSRAPVTATILAIGKITEIKVKVHDLITPYIVDEVNDKLYIENIDKFDFNTVTLLDRWGVAVEHWSNFQNGLSYDFQRLSPGNYICIVEFGNTGEGASQKVSQMVTVLKTK